MGYFNKERWRSSYKKEGAIFFYAGYTETMQIYSFFIFCVIS